MDDEDPVVVVERFGLAGWRVSVRRLDGSLRLVGGGFTHARADLFAGNLRRALADGAGWALALRDVSAGELRTSP